MAFAAALGFAALIGSGCSDSTGPVRIPWPFAPVPTPPAASSPAGVLRLVEWCWNELDVTSYRGVFSEDYRFVFSALDPNGNAYRSTPWTREDELACLAHLAAARPLRVSVAFERDLRVTDDPRPGHLPPWHKLIRTSVTVRVVTPDRDIGCSGYANFFVVRGDSAAIPSDLAAAGVRPDSTRWYVERWEDDTFQDYGAHAMPVKQVTWGSIKALFR